MNNVAYTSLTLLDIHDIASLVTSVPFISSPTAPFSQTFTSQINDIPY